MTESRVERKTFGTHEHMKKIRAFIALKLPQTVIDAIRQAQRQLVGHRLNIRWVKAENIHLTLKFLGDMDPARIDEVADAMADAAHGRVPFKLSAKGVGVFPNIRRMRVIWVGLDGQLKELLELQHAMEDRLVSNGFPIERRRFSGHLTIGRSKGVIDAGMLQTAMNDLQAFQSEPFGIDQVILYRSELHPTGSVYTQLRRVILPPPERGCKYESF